MKQEFATSVLNRVKPVNLPYQLILFDFDGTLCSTEGVDIRAIQKTHQSLHQPVPTVEMIQRVLGQGLIAKVMFQYLNPHADASLIQKLFLTYKAMYQIEAASAILFPGVVPLLKQIKQANITSLIVSNKAIELLESAVTMMQLGEYFEKVVGVQADGLCKPDSAYYDRYIKPHFKMVPPHQRLMVGDTSTDLKFAQTTQMDVAWASYGSGDPESCQALEPTYTLQTISDLPNIIFTPYVK